MNFGELLPFLKLKTSVKKWDKHILLEKEIKYRVYAGNFVLKSWKYFIVPNSTYRKIVLLIAL